MQILSWLEHPSWLALWTSSTQTQEGALEIFMQYSGPLRSTSYENSICNWCIIMLSSFTRSSYFFLICSICQSLICLAMWLIPNSIFKVILFSLMTFKYVWSLIKNYPNLIFSGVIHISVLFIFLYFLYRIVCDILILFNTNIFI